MNKNKIITISREYGSGGREIGQKLAERLGVPFYDNEIISRAAKESGFAVEAFENAESKAVNSLLYSIAMGMNVYSGQEAGFSGLSLDDRIFLAQGNVIRKVAEEGPCVIVGRCAEYILRERDDVINIFVQAAVDARIERAIKQYNLPKETAAEQVLKNDKRRANYYKYHAGDKWASMRNYDLMVRSDFGGIDHAVDVIAMYIGNK